MDNKEIAKTTARFWFEPVQGYSKEHKLQIFISKILGLDAKTYTQEDIEKIIIKKLKEVKNENN